VPSRAQITLEFRDSDPDLLGQLEAAIFQRLEQLGHDAGITIEAQATARIPPARTDEGLSATIAQAARHHGSEPLLMQSGAGHDCMILGETMPTGMMFIPSIGGRSHDIQEDTDEDDITFGCQVMASAVERLVGA
jgi:N-carbamoyl-L-amino-acid hydrolase